MRTTIEQILRQHIIFDGEPWLDLVPADEISRQAWQETVEILVEEVRIKSGYPTLELHTSEVSIFYHKTIGDFIQLVVQKTRMDF